MSRVPSSFREVKATLKWRYSSRLRLWDQDMWLSKGTVDSDIALGVCKELVWIWLTVSGDFDRFVGLIDRKDWGMPAVKKLHEGIEVDPQYGVKFVVTNALKVNGIAMQLFDYKSWHQHDGTLIPWLHNELNSPGRFFVGWKTAQFSWGHAIGVDSFSMTVFDPNAGMIYANSQLELEEIVRFLLETIYQISRYGSEFFVEKYL
jgi:hypothetical protein